MNRRELEDRLCALEQQVTPTTALSGEEITEFVASRRAQGMSEPACMNALSDRDPSLLRRGFFGIKEYTCHEMGFGPVHAWACRSGNYFIRLIGWLQHEVAINVATPEGERYYLSFSRKFQWRELDPIALLFLAILVDLEEAWGKYWSRPQEFRSAMAPVTFYFGSAVRRGERYVAENSPEVAEKLRRELREMIDWILAQEIDPDTPEGEAPLWWAPRNGRK